tara:strand:- start:11108 stop:12715 length:1608 start_codon:yes stop_codon:yes gene_type:complete
MINILHITDLHLENFEGDSDEFLRKGFYKEYIDRLYQSLNYKHDSVNIDYLIVTGDFINIGTVENYSSIKQILDYIASKFSVKPENICLSIGNHDYKWKELVKHDLEAEKELKKPFYKLVKEYSSNLQAENMHFFLNPLSENCFFLSLDSSWNSQNGAPGTLSQLEEDQIIEELRESLTLESTLLIGCHFPVLSYDNNFLASEEPNWHENHVWIKASTLRDRIKRIETANTVWFHGDVHASDPKSIENEVFVLTSKFGGKTDQSEQKRNAVIISIDDKNISKIICRYEFPTHCQNASLGDWLCGDKQELRSLNPVAKPVKITTNVLTSYNQEIEKEILRVIRTKELYKFGRFHVSEDYISLGWVEIIKLMNDKTLLSRIADKSYEIIKSNISDPFLDSLFLGVEIIGGILAAQLSVRFDANNSIVPIRTKSEHYSEYEFSHSSAFDNLASMKNVVIFIDLISSGKTIISLVNEIKEKNSSVNIHVISVISNNVTDRLNSIPNSKSYHTFCSSLKIPIIKHSDMPDEIYVQPNLRY